MSQDKQISALSLDRAAHAFGKFDTLGAANSYALHATGLPSAEGILAELRKRNAELRPYISDLNHKKEIIKDKIELLDQFNKCIAPWHLSKPQGTRFHSALGAALAGDVHYFADKTFKECGPPPRTALENVRDNYHIFLVEHDWAQAFEKSDINQGEYKLPFAWCVFEFVLNDVPLCVLIGPSDGVSMTVIFIKSSKGWGAIEVGEGWPFIMSQIRAMCIALDAEVAISEIVRAPHKLNSARQRGGKLPIFDYHVVSLANRRRAATLPDHESGKPKRLHWRRGHWRHFPTFKTWIRWTLVGNPDLGFVDKHYKL